MRVELLVPHRLSKRKARSAQEPLVDVVDDVRSIFRGVCGEIAGQAQFVIAGFGQDPWPVELQRDLPVLLEHLPRTLAAVSSSEPVVLDFSGRGLAAISGFVPVR